MYSIGKLSADNLPVVRLSATDCIDAPLKVPCGLKFGDTACCPK